MWERLSDVSGDNAHCGPDFRAYHGSPARPPPTAPAGGGAITMDHLQSVRPPHPPRPCGVPGCRLGAVRMRSPLRAAPPPLSVSGAESCCQFSHLLRTAEVAALFLERLALASRLLARVWPVSEGSAFRLLEFRIFYHARVLCFACSRSGPLDACLLGSRL